MKNIHVILAAVAALQVGGCRCFTGSAPSLRLYVQTHGMDNCKVWLSVHIKDLCEYAGVRKMSPSVMEDVADTIITRWPSLKLTEFMVFMQLFKSGEYGKFFGTADPVVLTSSLNDFVEGYRTRELARIARDEDRTARETSLAAGVTMDEAARQGLCPNIMEIIGRTRR